MTKTGASGAGDIIIGRRNNHDLQAGEEGRTLASGDVMRIEAVTDDGTLMVRRRTDRDPATGARSWSEGVGDAQVAAMAAEAGGCRLAHLDRSPGRKGPGGQLRASHRLAEAVARPG